MVMSLAGHTTSKMVNLLVTTLDSNPSVAQEQLQNICYEETSQYLPELLGKLYLETVLNDQTSDFFATWKEDVNLLVQSLNQSFHQQFNESKWMDPLTAQGAVLKLNSMSMNIGYPDWYNNADQFDKFCQMVCMYACC